MKPPAFMKRKKNMTLEKLLIFGFALAVLGAVTTLGADIWDKRKTKSGDVQTAIEAIN